VTWTGRNEACDQLLTSCGLCGVCLSDHGVKPIDILEHKKHAYCCCKYTIVV